MLGMFSFYCVPIVLIVQLAWILSVKMLCSRFSEAAPEGKHPNPLPQHIHPDLGEPFCP